VPLHKPHERGYAESEIEIVPYPPQIGEDVTVSTVVQNTSEETMTVELEFGWAQFGMGIAFTTTGMSPYTRSVTLGAEMTKTASVSWTPSIAGPQCIQVRLGCAGYEDQLSQRNVNVDERPPCGVTEVYTFTVHNDTPFRVTVDIGMATFNVPANWQVSVVPSGTIEIAGNSSATVSVTVMIPCPRTMQALFAEYATYAVQQQAGGVPTIDVEAYVVDDLVGGIELRFEGQAARIFLPVVMKQP
jgi:hypothetical protein